MTTAPMHCSSTASSSRSMGTHRLYIYDNMVLVVSRDGGVLDSSTKEEPGGASRRCGRGRGTGEDVHTGPGSFRMGDAARGQRRREDRVGRGRRAPVRRAEAGSRRHRSEGHRGDHGFIWAANMVRRVSKINPRRRFVEVRIPDAAGSADRRRLRRRPRTRRGSATAAATPSDSIVGGVQEVFEVGKDRRGIAVLRGLRLRREHRTNGTVTRLNLDGVEADDDRRWGRASWPRRRH